jgi:hypothetical protein
MNFDIGHYEQQAMERSQDPQLALVSAVLALAAAVERIARALEAAPATETSA